MDSSVEGPEVSDDLCKYSKASVSLDSEEFKGWWSAVLESSSLVIRKDLDRDSWSYLMRILAKAPVSGIEHLVLKLPHRLAKPTVARAYHISGSYAGDVIPDFNEVGTVLATGRFSALKTLRILVYDTQVVHWLKQHPAEALRKGRFRNLQTLSLPTGDVSAVLEALIEGDVRHLTSLSMIKIRGGSRTATGNLDAILESDNFTSLQHLHLSHLSLLDWRIFTKVVKFGKLPKITSLCLLESELSNANLADLVARSPANWFNSLESLNLAGCGITSKEVCSLVDAVIQVPNTESKPQLALKSLDLHDNSLDYKAVDALISLAHSGGLLQLQELDLSNNRYMKSSASVSQDLDSLRASTSLRTLLVIQMGGLPRLRKLNWEKNGVVEADIEAIVKAYFENQALTTEIHLTWDDVRDISLKTKLKTYRVRNSQRIALKEKLGEDLGHTVPLTQAKVFLCGFAEVGKTTLRRTLLRYFGKRTKFMWERRPVKEPRTRGIEISRIEAKKSRGDNTTLALWDLAGQEEYHVLHGTFLADLGFEGGKATTFVLVFKASLEADVRDKLLYWLRFVASCSLRHVKRHVVIVLNCFNGRIYTEDDQRLWKGLIESCATTFNDLLDIHLEPFVIDVRRAAPSQLLKDHLFNQARASLEDVHVPEICFELDKELKGWFDGEKSDKLPILTWEAFEESWKSKHKGNHFCGRALEIAASYLHEVGEIIYFKEKAVANPRSGNRSIVVPYPEWFCRRVVGELLLPKKMFEGSSSLRVSDDGSISVIRFEAFFKDLLVRGTRSDDIISMLELVGLCYRKGEEEIIVPALIQKDDYRSISWEGKGFHGVMGRCVATKENDKNLIPVTLFRRLQVELAQDSNFGGRGDNEYRVGKCFLSFKHEELLVLIQFDVDHSDPSDDRIDILVKTAIRGDPEVANSAQVECICQIMQKVEDLCVACCPGLRYDIKVIDPSTAEERPDKMSERKLMPLQEIKDLVTKGKKYLTWQRGGHPMELKTFLSKSELEELVGTVEREYDECKRDIITMGLLHEVEGECSYRSLTGAMRSMSVSCETNDEEPLTTKIFHQEVQELKIAFRQEGHDIRQYIDKKSTEVLLEFREKHELLVKEIQAQQSFSIAEQEASVPRYIFLSRKQGQKQVWITLREPFQRSFELHMLCEANFDNGFLHEVKGQEGIELTKPKEWLVKVSPLIRRSLQVAVVVGKFVGNIYLPGVFNFLPDYTKQLLGGGKVTEKAVDSAATMIAKEDEEADHQVYDADGNYGRKDQPINLKERLIAQEVVKDLIGTLGHAAFARKIGLRKVLLRTSVQAHIGCSKQAEPCVLWICDDCFEKYGSRATDISPMYLARLTLKSRAVSTWGSKQ